MPSRDKYHEVVVRALEKDGWTIAKDPMTLMLEDRRLYIDLLAERDNVEGVFIEIKVFEKMASPMNYIANSVGQYKLYEAALDWLEDSRPIYLAVPNLVYDNFLTEPIVAHFLKIMVVKIVIYDPVEERILRWIP